MGKAWGLPKQSGPDWDQRGRLVYVSRGKLFVGEWDGGRNTARVLKNAVSDQVVTRQLRVKT